MRVEIKWKHFAQGVYTHGSKLDFQKQSIAFDNPLMPPSFEIKRWHSRTNFQANRQTPNLPILKRGERYQLMVDAESFPKDSFYIGVHFFNRFGKQIGFEILKTTDAAFTYPNDAYSYDIALLNAGCEQLTFKSMILKSTDSSTAFQVFTDVKYKPRHSGRLNLIFLEDEEDLHYDKELFSEVADTIGDVIFIADSYGELSMLDPQTEAFILEAVDELGHEKVCLFSYGKKGNSATWYYAGKIKSCQVYTNQNVYEEECATSPVGQQAMGLQPLVEEALGESRTELPTEACDVAIVRSLVHPLRLLMQQFLDKDGLK
ncbi:TPA: accessory Sec system protein Asp3 [Streptococcus suis]|nr:accessory Sec system protein Asp3 [Streptococcus suis]